MVKEIDNINLEKDIIVNIKPQYGTIGFIKCNVTGTNQKHSELFNINLSSINKNKKFIIDKNSFNNSDKNFICFFVKLQAPKGKSKKEAHITLLQGKTKLRKSVINDDVSTSIFRIL